VPRLDPSLIEVYAFRRRLGRVEHLVLRRAAGRTLPGVWQPVTGGLRRGESALRGALRELREETGLRARRLWRLETAIALFDPGRDAVQVVIRFAAEIGAGEPVRLSREHTAHRFLPARAAAQRFLWDTQRDGLAAVGRQVIRGGRRSRALEIEIPARRI
jgi:8-oxo-dGTP pyrophosphatase MutT (NUDIX family)